MMNIDWFKKNYIRRKKMKRRQPRKRNRRKSLPRWIETAIRAHKVIQLNL
jgi:hypothetical protein